MKIKKIIYSFGILLAIGLMFFSCRKEKFNFTLAESNSQSIVNVDMEKMTVLGKKLKNPFEINNMREAYKAITKEKSGESIEPNRLYVRFLPRTAEEMASIYDSTLNFELIPLDREVISYGDYYQDSSTAHMGTTWVYTTVPIDYRFNHVAFEIIDSLYLTDEEEDKNLDIDLDLLESVALKLAGYHYEDDNVQTKSQKRPKGYVRYQQKIGSTLTNVAVKHIRVQSRWWFSYGEDITDDLGYFECDKTYKHTRDVVVKVHFENNWAKVRTIKGINFLHLFFVEDNTLGVFSGNSLENINYVHTNTVNDSPANLASSTKRKWIACHAITSIREFRGMAGDNGIPYQSSGLNGALNLWVTGEASENGPTLSRYASAPMLKQIANNSPLIAWLKMYLLEQGHPLFAALVQVTNQFLPDITYNYSEFSDSYYKYSDFIILTFYHELAHASHYYKVGNIYWNAYIAYILENGGYGTPQDSGAGRIAVAEAWAEYCGATFAHLRYGEQNSITNNWQIYLERFIPNAGTSYWRWIPEGIMHDLVDTGEPPITSVLDNVSGFSMKDCYDALEPTVTSVGAYRIKFINQNAASINSVILNDMNILFDSYGY